MNVLIPGGRAAWRDCRKCDRFWRQRSKIAAFYRDRFSHVSELLLPPVARPEDEHSLAPVYPAAGKTIS